MDGQEVERISDKQLSQLQGTAYWILKHPTNSRLYAGNICDNFRTDEQTSRIFYHEWGGSLCFCAIGVFEALLQQEEARKTADGRGGHVDF